jgi:hypothetical protein
LEYFDYFDYFDCFDYFVIIITIFIRATLESTFLILKVNIIELTLFKNLMVNRQIQKGLCRTFQKIRSQDRIIVIIE